MFIRGRETPTEVWQRFHLPVEGFVVEDRADLFAARIVANANWAIDLFLALSERLSPSVRVAVHDVRSGRRWLGEALPLSAVRDAVVELRPALMDHAGVEMALFDDGDQVTLSPHLEVLVYARTDRWFYMLRDLGLRRYRSLAARSWRLEDGEFPPAPRLETALSAAIDRLALEPA